MERRPIADEELARLRESNARLDEQVKLLVQTEQRLYRSQNQLDRQLQRIRALSDFALEFSPLERPLAALARATRLLTDNFSIDRAVTVLCESDDGRPRIAAVHPPGKHVGSDEPIDVGLVRWVVELQRSTLLGADDPAVVRWIAPLLRRLVRPGEESVAPSGGVVLCQPLRISKESLFGFILARSTRAGGRPYLKEELAEEHLPFIRLAGAHLERALQGTTLTSSLHERSRELSHINAQLTSSLEELERTQQQLLQSQKMEAIGRLAGGVAHDFNNLLTVILGHAQLVEESAGEDGEILENVTNIIDASDRAAKLTTQLLAFSRKQHSAPQVVDLNRLAAELAKMLARLVGERVHLELKSDPTTGPIRADPGQVEQILMNLVVNGRDAMPDGGTLTIETRPAAASDIELAHADCESGRCAVLSVSDEGSGMDAETRAQIFEPFFTTKAVGRGTGMGLAMVYGLVLQNAGFIAVESEIGQGSRFTVLLPAASSRERQLDRAAAAPRVASTGGTILIVEDEEIIRRLAVRVLKSKGYEVYEAADGVAAVEIARRVGDRLDLLVSDVVMPHLGGAELAAELRKERPDLPVLYISGYAAEMLDIRGLGEGEAYLPKPFTPRVLLEKIATALAGRKPPGAS